MSRVKFTGFHSKQQGAAGIIFLATVPFLFMAFAFSVSVSQRLNTHVKMVEATEIASIALATDQKGDEYASAIINRYLVDNTGAVTASVQEENCTLQSGCVAANGESSAYTDVTVVASSTHKSWFTYESINLKAEFEVGGKSKARKYAMRPVDLYFITDLSDSMGGNRNIWGFRIPGPKRLDWTKNGIKDTFRSLKALDGTGQSRVSLQGFNSYHVIETDMLIQEASSFLISGKSYMQKVVYNYDRGSAFATARDMFKPPQQVTAMRQLRPGIFIDLFGRVFNDNIAANYPFYDIRLTNNIDAAVNRVGGLNAYGGSSSWNGIIAAAQVANNASSLNPEQVFVILSDGYDNDRWRLKQMVDQGLCTNLKNQIESKKSNLASNTRVHLMAIGLNYTISPNDGIGACVGAGNIYRADSAADIQRRVIELIQIERARLRV